MEDPNSVKEEFGNSDLCNESQQIAEVDPEKRAAVETYEMDTRILIPSGNAGPLIGRGGENIKKLRTEFDLNVSIPDSPTPERVVYLVGNKLKMHLSCVQEILSILERNQKCDKEGRIDFRILVHESQAGAIIGRNGDFIKSLRSKYKCNVSVFSVPAPSSTDRVCLINGNIEQITCCLIEIYDVLHKAPPRGHRNNYNANFYDEYLVHQYGGYKPDGEAVSHRFRGTVNSKTRRSRSNYEEEEEESGFPLDESDSSFSSKRPRFPDQYDYSAEGGYGDRKAMYDGSFGDPTPPAMRQRYAYDEGYGVAAGDPENPSDREIKVVRVTIPKNMEGFGPKCPIVGYRINLDSEYGLAKKFHLAGAIIGQNGDRIRHIRQESRCKIKIEESESGASDRIISIEGVGVDTKYAQALLQQAVKQNSGGAPRKRT